MIGKFLKSTKSSLKELEEKVEGEEVEETTKQNWDDIQKRLSTGKANMTDLFKVVDIGKFTSLNDCDR